MKDVVCSGKRVGEVLRLEPGRWQQDWVGTHRQRSKGSAVRGNGGGDGCGGDEGDGGDDGDGPGGDHAGNAGWRAVGLRKRLEAGRLEAGRLEAGRLEAGHI